MATTQKPVIAITAGDPAGVGPEITIQAVLDPGLTAQAHLCVIGEKAALAAAAEVLNLPLNIVEIEDPRQAAYADGTVTLINTATLDAPLPWGEISSAGGAAAWAAIQKANALAVADKVDAITTAPIHKESLKAAAVPYIDHTSMLAGLTGSENVMTLFATRTLKVFFLTKHIALRDVGDAMTEPLIHQGIAASLKGLKALGIQSPSLAVAALNPHGGEHGLFGTEEDDVIRPALASFQPDPALNASVCGPVPADAVFHQCSEGRYDAVLSLYHDQGHIAAKTLDFHGTVSFALGLPYLRTSVDHGTAFDIAGKNIVNAHGMKEATLAAIKYALSYKAELQG